jgi:hypothetical protein
MDPVGVMGADPDVLRLAFPVAPGPTVRTVAADGTIAAETAWLLLLLLDMETAGGRVTPKTFIPDALADESGLLFAATLCLRFCCYWRRFILRISSLVAAELVKAVAAVVVVAGVALLLLLAVAVVNRLVGCGCF